MRLTRESVLIGLCTLAAGFLLAFLLARGVLKEVPGSNSYAALADAFLHGRFWVEKCPEIDCAVFNGRTYIIFPPLPALVAMPFVALFGVAGFKGFILVSLALAAAALVVWHRILEEIAPERGDSAWVLLALGFASPVFQVVLRSDGVWFAAQSLGFLMMTLSIWAVVCRHSLVLAGLFVGLAFLCRQMAIFYPLFLLALAMEREEPLLDELRRLFRPLLGAGALVLAILALVLAYNAARFGSPFDTGYAHISNPETDNFIARRIADLGIFSREYLSFNLAYLLVQGVHFEFTGPHLTKLTGIDKSGVALLVASPWLLLAYFARLDRVFVAGMVVIGIIAGITLFYHSNGVAQFNTQRYALDWLPILVVLMMRQQTRPPAFAALPLLVSWGVLTNAVVVGVAAWLRL